MIKRKILIFLPCLTLGGAERQASLLARHLSLSGHSVQVWGFPPPGASVSLRPFFASEGIEFIELPRWPHFDWQFSSSVWRNPYMYLKQRFRHWPASLLRYAKLLPSSDFDLIIPFTIWPCLVSCLLRDDIRSKKVIWNHRGGYHDAGISYTPFLRREILRKSSAFVANTSIGAKFVERKFGLPDGTVRVIPNVATLPEIEVNKVKPTPGSPINLVHVANTFPEKDLMTLLDALSVGGINERYRLHLVGSFIQSQDESIVRNRIEALTLEKQVVIYGGMERETLEKLIQQCDIGLLSSRSEGMPNSIMEFMGAGLPVIATDIPGIRELVGKNNYEWLFPVGDPDALRKRLDRLAENPELRLRLGTTNRHLLESEFGPLAIYARWDDFVNELFHVQ